MKKILIIPIFLIIILFISGCSFFNKSTIVGFYESELVDNAYVIQITISKDETSFVEYINNRQVDKGQCKVIDNSNNKKYQLIGELQTSEIVLNNKNLLEIKVGNLNEGKTIELKNISSTPTVFSQEFDDVDKYKMLIKK